MSLSKNQARDNPGGDRRYVDKQPVATSFSSALFSRRFLVINKLFEMTVFCVKVILQANNDFPFQQVI